MSAEEAVDILNALYLGYNHSNTSSPLGVTVRFTQDKNLFYCGTPCYKGHADCRVSGSILNHEVQIHEAAAGGAVTVAGTMSIMTGFVFNQSMVEDEVGKCYYQFDGATDRRYNMGCGCGAPTSNCGSPQSAYQSIDPGTKKPMTAKSKDIADCHCLTGARARPAPASTTEVQCFWKGPAFYPGSSADELRAMLDDRVRNQVGVETVGPEKRVKQEYWNEVVIDGELLQAKLDWDPSAAITAVVWLKSGNPLQEDIASKKAQQMSENIRDTYSMPKALPVIALDVTQDIRQQGPFKIAEPTPITAQVVV